MNLQYNLRESVLNLCESVVTSYNLEISQRFTRLNQRQSHIYFLTLMYFQMKFNKQIIVTLIN